MEVGKYNKLPHYNIVGEPTSFYVWVNEDNHGASSKWIKGRPAFKIYNKLALLFKNDKPEFIKLLKRTFDENGK